MMSAEQWLVVLLLAGLAGAGGQVARVVVGLKKLNDAAAAEGKTMADMIDVSRLSVSVLIGFVAGMLAAIGMFDPAKPEINGEVLMGFAAAGYLGADFIEGLMSRHLKKDDKKPDDDKPQDDAAAKAPGGAGAAGAVAADAVGALG